MLQNVTLLIVSGVKYLSVTIVQCYGSDCFFTTNLVRQSHFCYFMRINFSNSDYRGVLFYFKNV
jgi:hypothetical protein